MNREQAMIEMIKGKKMTLNYNENFYWIFRGTLVEPWVQINVGNLLGQNLNLPFGVWQEYQSKPKTKMQVFIINGKGGVGKDTFINFFAEHLKDHDDSLQVRSVSSTKEIKELAKEFFKWNGEKNNATRKMLSDLKDLHTDFCDGPFNMMKREYDKALEDGINYLFFHIREPDEIRRAVEIFDAKTIVIVRDGVGSFENHADDNVFDYFYLYGIKNQGSLQDFNEKVKLFCRDSMY